MTDIEKIIASSVSEALGKKDVITNAVGDYLSSTIGKNLLIKALADQIPEIILKNQALIDLINSKVIEKLHSLKDNIFNCDEFRYEARKIINEMAVNAFKSKEHIFQEIVSNEATKEFAKKQAIVSLQEALDKTLKNAFEKSIDY